jgi:hypothetical protein
VTNHGFYDEKGVSKVASLNSLNPPSYPDFLDKFKQFEGSYHSILGEDKITP